MFTINEIDDEELEQVAGGYSAFHLDADRLYKLGYLNSEVRSPDTLGVKRLQRAFRILGERYRIHITYKPGKSRTDVNTYIVDDNEMTQKQVWKLLYHKISVYGNHPLYPH